jgi:hypothetical protein
MEPENRESLYAFLERRSRELTNQIAALKSHLTACETELAHVQSAQRQFANFPEADRARMGFPMAMRQSHRLMEQTYSANLTIKQLIMKAMRAHFKDGATAADLRDFIKDAYGRDIERASFSPQLSRLKAQGLLHQNPETERWTILASDSTVDILLADDNDDEQTEQLPDLGPAPATLKEMILRVLWINKAFRERGATSADLRRVIQIAYKHESDPLTFREQLGRLNAQGVLKQKGGDDNWRLTKIGEAQASASWENG